VNRGHSFEESERMIHLTAEKGIHTGAHFIMGLPGETREMMLHTAGIISRMPMETVKFHQLQIMKNTPMAEEYVKNPGEFHLFGLEDYVDFFVDFLERLSPRLIIERFAGEAPPRHLVNQVWKVRNYELINMLEKRLEERGTCQGKFYKE
ncbi:MAG: TIGR01212 family radical SAM protein, partial [Bacteroidota bacterium]